MSEDIPTNTSHSDQVRLAATPKWIKRIFNARVAFVFIYFPGVLLAVIVFLDLTNAPFVSRSTLDQCFSISMSIFYISASIGMLIALASALVDQRVLKNSASRQQGAPQTSASSADAREATQQLTYQSVRTPEQARAYFDAPGRSGTSARLRLESNILMITLGVLGGVVALFLMVKLDLASSSGSAIGGLIGLGVVFVLRMRRRRMSQSVEAAIMHGEPFLLYLRSFDDDEEVGLEHDNAAIAQTISMGYRTGATFEQVALATLARSMLVVMVGPPDKMFPPLFAFPVYAETANWNAKVSDLLGKCSYVIVLLGISHGLDWELKRILNGGDKDKAIFVLPPGSPELRKARWMHFSSLVDDRELAAELLHLDHAEVLAFCFTPNKKVFSVAGPIDEFMAFDEALSSCVAQLGTRIKAVASK